MTARVLVVDDILANVRLLEAKLASEYFDVVTAMNGVDALETVQRAKPDIVLLDIMMPGIDGIEVCRRIKDNPGTQHIPVIMVTALDQPEDRVKGLQAGADDFLTKPVNDLALFCRVKSLVRLKMLTDELRARAVAADYINKPVRSTREHDGHPGKVLVISTRPSSADRIRSSLAGRHDVTIMSDPQAALAEAAKSVFELIAVDFDMENIDGLRLCAQLKSLEKTRQTPLLIIVDPNDHSRLMKALDMGVNDYLMRPIDKQELLARVNTQVRRWRYTEQLRTSVQSSIELAVTDPLTGLFNRRYLESHLVPIVENTAGRGKALTVLAIDIDFFKAVNDNHGHDMGDRVLQEMALRLKQNMRNIDILCRTGGEEFIAVLPETNRDAGLMIAERIRKAIAVKPFDVGAKTGPLSITASVGVAVLGGPRERMEDILKRADDALYRAKRDGRNCVSAAA
jgi:two-component system, cell cycle response regulator